ncbi:MAG: dipeptidase [Phycisphaerae bacterium]|nr:dipeptidase [Phycisphaerae bacterium]
MPHDAAPVLAEIDRTLDASLARLVEFLRIPSVSTDPAFAPQVRRCAEWIAGQLRECGFETTVHATRGHPMVTAKAPGPSVTAPRILYYGHYDVQPPDPLDLWESPPFEPAIREGPHGRQVVARGAVDDKGQVMTFVEAFRAWKKVHGSFPCAITVVLEGEEESGSPSLVPFVESHAKLLAADTCVVCDTGMWDIDTPAITAMLRGLVYAEIVLKGPSHDLHSGMYGGTLRNPINALASMIAELHDRRSRVTLCGFYDRVIPIPADLASKWKALPFDENDFLSTAGMRAGWGEEGFSMLERMWARPTCDCNGILGGYTGVGGKTVIPAVASTKVSFRLVPDQSPAEVFDALDDFVRAHTPEGFRAEVIRHSGSPAVRVPIDSPWLAAASRGLERVYRVKPAIIGTGGSIPAVGDFRRILGIDALLVGFGLDDDRVHSPNEKFEVTCLERGIRSHAAMLEEFARTPRSAPGGGAE